VKLRKEGRILLPKGEGGPKGRMRGEEISNLHPSPAASRHPLPSGEGLPLFYFTFVPGSYSREYSPFFSLSTNS
jgi:hypothetical protein